MNTSRKQSASPRSSKKNHTANVRTYTLTADGNTFVDKENNMFTEKELQAAYLAGFNASAEGYNGEYPYADNSAWPEADSAWVAQRDLNLKGIVSATLTPQPYKLEKNIPVPDKFVAKKGDMRLLLEQMDVGDSFVCPNAQRTRLHQMSKAMKIVITTRTINTETRDMRVWRTA